MNNEFKKIKSNQETRYVLETMTAGATGASSIATSVGGVGKVQKRNPDNILAQEGDKITVPVTQKPRQGPLRKQTGAGAHRDKKKEQKQGKEKHRKPFAENINTDSGAEDFRDFANFYNDPDPTHRPPEAEEGVKMIAHGRNPKVAAQNIVNFAQANPDAVEDVMNPEQLADAIEQLKLLIGQGVGEGIDQMVSSGHKIIANRKTPKGNFVLLQNKNDGRYEIHKFVGPASSTGYEFVSVHKSPEEMQTAFRNLTGVDEGVMKPDHEISMASNELKSITADAMKLLMLIKRYSEMDGLEAWQQSKITKAADYLNSVLQSISGEQSTLEGLRDPKDNPCWKGYKPVGTKKKGGRTVPNCVPKEGIEEGAEFGSKYAEQVAQQIFNKRQDISSEDEVLNQAYHIVSNDQGQKAARYMFNYDEDFPSDLVSAYFWLQKNSDGVTEEQGYDEVSPKSASYILRKLDQGVPMSNIIDDFPELNRMMEIIAGEHGLHPDDDFEQIEDILMNDLEDIAAQEDDFGDYNQDEEQPDEYMESLTQYLQSALNEKAVSKAQQRFMGMVHAAQKGEKAASPEVAKVAKGMGKKAAKDFASTKHKGLPDKKKSKK